MSVELESKNQSLLNGTIVYFIGNVLTQLISILLLKLITGTVTTAEYGYFNLVVTVDNLITPILTLQISDAVFRFFITSKSEAEKSYIYSSGIAVIAFGALLICLLVGSLRKILGIQYSCWVVLYILSTNLFGFNQKIIRSLGKNKEYVKANLMKSVIYLALIFIVVIKLKMGAKGLFISNCVSTYLCIIYLIIKVQTNKYFNLHKISLHQIRAMLKFSAPLIPNTAIWWLQSSVNSLIITNHLGISYNGIYSVAVKFASVLHLVINVFDLAWQESAIKEFGKPYYKEFVTKTFNQYLVFLLSCVAVLIPFLRLVMEYLIDSAYIEAIPYIPFLLFSTAISACSGYFAQMIVAKNKNMKLLTTNFIGAISNILVVYVLLKYIGIWAIVISAVLSYSVIAIARYYQVKEDFMIEEVQFKHLSLLLLLNILSCITFVVNIKSILFLNFVAMGIISILLNKTLLLDLRNIILNKVKNNY